MENLKNKTDLLKKIAYESSLIQIPSQEDYAIRIIDNLLQSIVDNNISINTSEDLFNFIDNQTKDNQETISFYLNCILHEPRFQKLEATWLSIGDLVKNSEIGIDLKIQLMQANIQELMDDIEKAPDFDQSFLFRKFYEENYGTPGGEPIACVVLDHYFTKSPQDVKLMSDLANIFASAHIQTITSVHPSVFDLQDFTQVNNLIDLKSNFESPEFISWNAFRKKDEARYITLVLPRVLKRVPYDTQCNPIKSISFKENIGLEGQEDFCWGNAAYAMAQCITRSFSLYEWLASIRGVENGGKVSEMPIFTYKTASNEELCLCPVEVALTDRKEKELSDLGFLSLCYFKQTDYAVFFSSQTAIQAQTYDNPAVTGNALLSSSLPFMLNVSRFAHYMKCMIRDCIGSNMSRKDVETYLQNWIVRYVTLNEDADNETKAKYPLKAASVVVEEKLGQPGNYYAIVRMTPHFQLESINVSTRLVVDLASSSRE